MNSIEITYLTTQSSNLNWFDSLIISRLTSNFFHSCMIVYVKIISDEYIKTITARLVELEINAEYQGGGGHIHIFMFESENDLTLAKLSFQ